MTRNIDFYNRNLVNILNGDYIDFNPLNQYTTKSCFKKENILEIHNNNGLIIDNDSIFDLYYPPKMNCSDNSNNKYIYTFIIHDNSILLVYIDLKTNTKHSTDIVIKSNIEQENGDMDHIIFSLSLKIVKNVLYFTSVDNNDFVTLSSLNLIDKTIKHNICFITPTYIDVSIKSYDNLLYFKGKKVVNETLENSIIEYDTETHNFVYLLFDDHLLSNNYEYCVYKDIIYILIDGDLKRYAKNKCCEDNDIIYYKLIKKKNIFHESGEYIKKTLKFYKDYLYISGIEVADKILFCKYNCLTFNKIWSIKCQNTENKNINFKIINNKIYLYNCLNKLIKYDLDKNRLDVLNNIELAYSSILKNDLRLYCFSKEEEKYFLSVIEPEVEIKKDGWFNFNKLNKIEEEIIDTDPEIDDFNENIQNWCNTVAEETHQSSVPSVHSTVPSVHSTVPSVHSNIESRNCKNIKMWHINSFSSDNSESSDPDD